MLDLIIRGGRAVTPTAVKRLDIGVKDGLIAALGDAEHMAEARRTLDATGALVLPGLVDPHAHLHLPWGDDSLALEDFAGRSRPAAAGGVTSLLDFATQTKDHLPLGDLKKRRSQAKGQMLVDFGLHLVLTRMTPPALAELEEVLSMGIPSFKTYMTYPGEGVMADDGAIVALLEAMKGMTALWGNHAENASISQYLQQNYLAQGKAGARYQALSHPPLAEAEAINRALFLAHFHGVAYFNFHLSSALGLDLIRRARGLGQPVYAETCPRYLLLTEEKMLEAEDTKYICVPPLRTEEDREALWEGLADGSISVVSSDEAAYSIRPAASGEGALDRAVRPGLATAETTPPPPAEPGEERDAHQVEPCNVTRAPEGYQGFEFTLPLLYSRGVETGRISLSRLAQLVSTNPARIFGLFPQKGAILVGSDADLVILDPARKRQIKSAESHAPIEWLPYEGMTVSGWPLAYTLLRGEIIARDGQVVATEPRGQFLHRRLTRDLLQAPVV